MGTEEVSTVAKSGFETDIPAVPEKKKVVIHWNREQKSQNDETVCSPELTGNEVIRTDPFLITENENDFSGKPLEETVNPAESEVA